MQLMIYQNNGFARATLIIIFTFCIQRIIISHGRSVYMLCALLSVHIVAAFFKIKRETYTRGLMCCLFFIISLREAINSDMEREKKFHMNISIV